MLTATEKAIEVLKNPAGRLDDVLIKAIKQVIGYTPTHAIANDKEISSSDLLSDVNQFASLLRTKKDVRSIVIRAIEYGRQYNNVELNFIVDAFLEANYLKDK